MLAPAYPQPFQHPDFPGLTVFSCDSLRARLSPAACARNYTAGRMVACSGCRTGHRHAIDAGLIAKNVPLRCSSLVVARCTRCERPTSRLVHKRLCPSCFNREREILKGANAKGTKPTKTKLMVGAVIVDERPLIGGVEVLDIEDGVWLISMLVTGRDELDRAVRAIVLCAEIFDVSIEPLRDLTLKPSEIRLSEAFRPTVRNR